MGLDATVWKQDPDTLPDSIDLDEIELVHTRIGNISCIIELRAEIKSMEGDYPILLKKVLYSGTHCGDAIPADQISALCKELLLLKKGSELLEQFRTEMFALCDIALIHGRPIDF